MSDAIIPADDLKRRLVIANAEEDPADGTRILPHQV
jgi:hypothetical protein